MQITDFFLLSQNNKVDLTNNLKTNIMKTPTLEEVKAYFKNAKEVKCVFVDKVWDITQSGEIFDDRIGICFENESDYCRLYSYKKQQYAEIISYKDTYTVSKDFILEAHNSACSTWKTKIENQFPELFPKVELIEGKWYKRGSELLVWNGGKNTYGFTEDGYYYDDMLFSQIETAIPATKEEVETALINEAKKRGYNARNFKCLANLKSLNFGYWFYDKPTNRLYTAKGLLGGKVVFENGVWAEIISEPIELALEQIAEKFGVEVEQIKIKK